MTVSIRLPLPTSVNGLYFNHPKGGRRKTKAYRSWIKQAGLELILQRPEHIVGQVEIEVSLQDTGNRKTDADGRLKGLIDLLVTHQIIQADDKSIVRKVSVGWDAGVTGAVVTVKPIDDYDGSKDFDRSVTEAYSEVRQRVAAGGPGWNPKQ